MVGQFSLGHYNLHYINIAMNCIHFAICITFSLRCIAFALQFEYILIALYCTHIAICITFSLQCIAFALQFDYNILIAMYCICIKICNTVCIEICNLKLSLCAIRVTIQILSGVIVLGKPPAIVSTCVSHGDPCNLDRRGQSTRIGHYNPFWTRIGAMQLGLERDEQTRMPKFLK